MVLTADDDGATTGASGHVPLMPVPEERVAQNGHTRREALRQATRENMTAEIHVGLSETLRSGSMPGCARACGRFCGILIIVMLVSLLIFCICVGVCCCVMHLRGWYLTLWLAGCHQQGELRQWLFLFQSLSLLEACLRNRSRDIVRALDARFNMSCARATLCCALIISWVLKIAWCVHAQSVSLRSPTEDGCGAPLPRFMHWYSCVLFLQLVVVEPCTKMGMNLVLWAATAGMLQTNRGAKPGMLESLQVVDYDPELFASSEDPADSRPQRECCFCLEEYDSNSAIVRTPCNHYMHRECLKRWLDTSRFCPICRSDLEDLQQNRLQP